VNIKWVIALGALILLVCGILFIRVASLGPLSLSSGYEVIIVIPFLALVAAFVKYITRSEHAAISVLIQEASEIFKFTADRLGLSYRPSKTVRGMGTFPEMEGHINDLFVRISVHYKEQIYSMELRKLFFSIEIALPQTFAHRSSLDLDSIPNDQLSPKSISALERLRMRAYKSENYNGTLIVIIRGQRGKPMLNNQSVALDLERTVWDAVMLIEQITPPSE
jgi:hypothetical protein